MDRTKTAEQAENCQHALIFKSSCAIIAIIFLKLLFQLLKPREKLKIPGPFSIPFIGTLALFHSDTLDKMKQFNKKFGNLFKIQIGSQKMVVICGLEPIKQALRKSTLFAGRPKLYIFKYISEGKSLSFSTYDDDFKQHKQIAQKVLHNFMKESDFVNNVVCTESQNLIKTFLDKNGHAFDPLECVLWAVAHVQYTMCYGNSHTDCEHFKAFINNTIALLNSHKTLSMLNFFPLVRKIFSFKNKSIQTICATILKISKQKQSAHNLLKSGNAANLLEAFVHASKESEIEQDKLLFTTDDIIGAGLDVTYLTLTWAIMYLAQYPEIQRHFKEEIKSVILGKQPRKEDAASMPYAQAFIHEVLRHTSIVPFAVPHTNLEDAEVEDYFLPKDTFIMFSTYSVHNDPKLWPDPKKFDPNRFLDESGKFDLSSVDKKFMPFGLGKRKCIGENLAKQEIFIFLSSILQLCDIIKPDFVKDYDFTPVFGVVLKPRPFKVIIKCSVNN